MTLRVKFYENLSGISGVGSPGPEHVPVWQARLPMNAGAPGALTACYTAPPTR